MGIPWLERVHEVVEPPVDTLQQQWIGELVRWEGGVLQLLNNRCDKWLDDIGDAPLKGDELVAPAHHIPLADAFPERNEGRKKLRPNQGSGARQQRAPRRDPNVRKGGGATSAPNAQKVEGAQQRQHCAPQRDQGRGACRVLRLAHQATRATCEEFNRSAFEVRRWQREGHQSFPPLLENHGGIRHSGFSDKQVECPGVTVPAALPQQEVQRRVSDGNTVSVQRFNGLT